MTKRRALAALAAALLAASVASVLARLGRFPALTLDEAWTGIYAVQLSVHGLFTPHEMNTYTGPLFGLLVMKSFSLLGVGVRSLRLPGALANALALLLTAAVLGRRVRAESAAWWAALAAGSSFLLFQSRLAWDVLAFQPLLLALTLALLDGPAGPVRVFYFCAVTLVGIQNHFIYLSVPASLVALYAARAAWRGEEEVRPWLRASLSALGMGAVVFLVKPRLSEAAWARERVWAVPLFLALPFLAAAASAAGAWEGPLVRLLARPALRRWGLRAAGLGLLAFAVWHLLPVTEALAGPVVWKRMLAWDAPWWLDLPSELAAVAALALLSWRAVRAWHGREELSAFERTLALWPAAYAAQFILFRNTSSLRYYSPLQFLCLAGLAAALPRLPRPDKRFAAAAAALLVLTAQGTLWTAIAAPPDRRPISFKIGWHTENSWDFARKDAAFAALDASGACRPYDENSFIQVPLLFHRFARPLPSCDPDLRLRADQCRDCAVPPFYRWSVVRTGR
jgi:hypothetical protein